ncbi:ester cyclase [Paraburkholderia azotifigens]|uniref:Ester cyclase n=1 Tax=Paraburkholderia azotifigens TaxID=2057004 RepID=A0A5C6VIL8_9BURK|nr:ester cyclase [Paraburkholderia azotifigens]TXC84336.1 ester cyclase [Paraburkholderia azotifigens]
MSSRLASSLRRAVSAALAVASLAVVPAFAAAPSGALVEPQHLSVDSSLPKAQRDAQVLAARRYDTFWSTGDEALARAALAPGFTDRTLPPGRAQGIEGPLAASKFVRAAVPDLQAEIEQMVVAGDRVVVHLRFHGHFTGQFKGVRGEGQNIDFIATDIYRIADGRIAENWHLEDNLTFLQQLGVVAK